jgi:NitT/TauT family transport system substrate-binding protein
MHFVNAGFLSLLFPIASLAVTATPVKLALNWKAEPQFGGFYAAAIGKGFEMQNIKLEIREGGSGTPTVQMLANGKVDLAIVSAEEILISNDRNPKNKVVAVFAVYQTNPQMIMCHEESGFPSLKQVFESPVTIALQSGLTYAQFLKKKYPAAKAKLVPYLGGISHFLADKKFCQQGFSTSEPLAARKAGLKPKVFLIADEGFNPYTTVVAVREETLKKTKGLVQMSVIAIRAGWKEYLADPGATNAHMAKFNKAMDAGTFQKSAAAQIPLIETPRTKESGLGTMTAERWQELAIQLKGLGLIKTSPEPNSVFRNL